MKITSANYEHSRIGFPKVKLKWFYDGRHKSPYVTVHDAIINWEWKHPIEGAHCIDVELKRFDDWVVSRFGNDASVQG